MRLLVIDTCGEIGSLALAEEGRLLHEATLPARGSSAELIPAIRKALVGVGWTLAHLTGVGVVSGPGSFTGVRVGLAAGKALCEVGGLRLATVSRLAVLAEMASGAACAVLDAGRGECFVRTPRGNPQLLTMEALLAQAEPGAVWIAEPRLVSLLAVLKPHLVALSAAHAAGLGMRSLEAGGQDVALADAEYIRGEQDIYGPHRQNGAGSA